MPDCKTKMRAKMVVSSVMPTFDPDKNKIGEVVNFHAVARSTYSDTNGDDEDNTFAKYSPSASVMIHIANPALHDQFEPGQKFYVDFSPAA
ncbi:MULTISPECIES: hypothetical protein [unclassified Novosphingobium]|uniref:hypothetical protein n=1 Tax=unclassified Novosphingobium TaxID=2644732 RepID=UPI000D44D050|nr:MULTISPECIES: hypothetical protein [unclassified Novosphingobium]PTR08666.1 hypothetical protein C8K11_111112 [Novosphingobium sp. GV055]PUB01389.1 hypothetical protein C8K12_111112 [Novosphingobium sp. GV061]PUB16963.1 hypothetical protein C8K14_111112 [Novosphingobium sp. GV079]PUB39986.1 hypothetical protein C8K10_111112 [Novosphingobium sp. GV027]